MQENKYLQWLSKTDSIYWGDSIIYSDFQNALGNGAVGATSNPFLIHTTLTKDAQFWMNKISDLTGLSGDEKAEVLTREVVAFYAEEFRPMYEKGIPGVGYICAQTNPNKTGDTDYMIEQAKHYAAIAPNVVIKFPATKSGIVAYEECAALGMNTAATVSFTVPQVLAVAEARERGKKRALANGIKPGLGIAVMMVGRLDDYLRDVAHDSAPHVQESDIIQAGTACIKRAYQMFNEKGYDTYLMPAGCRGANHIVDLAGAKMIMSIAPKIETLLKDVDTFEERINIPVDPAIIERLMTMPEFRKAYEPDGMKPEEFITFGSANRTTDQFINDGWNPLTTLKY